MPGPQVGTVVDGYRFKGGNPNDAGAWEPVEKLTEDQGKSQDYARQMAEAERQYLQARRDGFDPTSARNGIASVAEDFKIPLLGTPLAALGPIIRDDAADKGVAAQRAWLDARLKAMTGAGQSREEAVENPRTYFPQPGEKDTWEGKYDIRRNAFESTKMRSGPAAASLPSEYPNPAKLPPQRQNLQARIEAAKGVVRVKSPEEAQKLAPGTVFITPDGRRKVR
jgi:hypothetical protein